MSFLGVYGDKEKTDVLLLNYMKGLDRNLTVKENETLTEIQDILGEYEIAGDLYYHGMQKCSDLFIGVNARGRSITWYDMGIDEDVGPYFYGTDAGACCLFSVELDMTNERNN